MHEMRMARGMEALDIGFHRPSRGQPALGKSLTNPPSLVFCEQRELLLATRTEACALHLRTH